MDSLSPILWGLGPVMALDQTVSPPAEMRNASSSSRHGGEAWLKTIICADLTFLKNAGQSTNNDQIAVMEL